MAAVTTSSARGAPTAPAPRRAAVPAGRRRAGLSLGRSRSGRGAARVGARPSRWPAVVLALRRAAALRCPLVGACWSLSWVRAADSLRPVIAARNAKQTGQPLSDAQVAAADRAIARAPVEGALVRWAIWTAPPVYVAVRLVRTVSWRGRRAPAWSASACCTRAAPRPSAASSGSGSWRPRAARSCRTSIRCARSRPPTGAGSGDGLARCWRQPRGQRGADRGLHRAVLAPGGHAAVADGPRADRPDVLLVPVAGARTRPIERYFDQVVRRPTSRGPARDDPRAVAAFRAAQSIPYRLAGYQALACAFGALAVVAVGRRLAGFDTATAGRLLAAIGLIILAMGLYETLLLRDVLRPAAGAAGLAASPAGGRGPFARRPAHQAGGLLHQRHRVLVGARAAVRAVAQSRARDHAGLDRAGAGAGAGAGAADRARHGHAHPRPRGARRRDGARRAGAARCRRRARPTRSAA